MNELDPNKVRQWCVEIMALTDDKLCEHVKEIMAPLKRYGNHEGTCSSACGSCSAKSFYSGLLKLFGRNKP